MVFTTSWCSKIWSLAFQSVFTHYAIIWLFFHSSAIGELYDLHYTLEESRCECCLDYLLLYILCASSAKLLFLECCMFLPSVHLCFYQPCNSSIKIIILDPCGHILDVYHTSLCQYLRVFHCPHFLTDAFCFVGGRAQET